MFNLAIGYWIAGAAFLCLLVLLACKFGRSESTASNTNDVTWAQRFLNVIWQSVGGIVATISVSVSAAMGWLDAAAQAIVNFIVKYGIFVWWAA